MKISCKCIDETNKNNNCFEKTHILWIIIIYFQFNNLYCRQCQKLVTMVPKKVKSHYLSIFRNCHLLLFIFIFTLILSFEEVFISVNHWKCYSEFQTDKTSALFRYTIITKVQIENITSDQITSGPLFFLLL